MEGTAIGYEVNIYQEDFAMKDIKSPDELFNVVKQVIDYFQDRRDCLPAELEFKDEEYNQIVHQQEITTDLISPSSGLISIVHYLTATDATYTFEYSDNKSPIKTKGLRFREMTVTDYDPTKGDETLSLELQGTGDAPIEETILFWIDESGQNHSGSMEHYVWGGMTDEQEEDLKEFTDQMYEEIFK